MREKERENKGRHPSSLDNLCFHGRGGQASTGPSQTALSIPTWQVAVADRSVVFISRALLLMWSDGFWEDLSRRKIKDGDTNFLKTHIKCQDSLEKNINKPEGRCISGS